MAVDLPAAPGGFSVPVYERPSGVHPPLNFPDYRSTRLRAPRRTLTLMPQRLTEITGPLLGEDRVTPADADLTMAAVGEAATGEAPGEDLPAREAPAEDVSAGNAPAAEAPAAEAQGQRIIVTGRVLDSDGRPVPDTLIEVWQANAAGRYAHAVDNHPAPLDPNFTGVGRCLTDSQGTYRFVTIKPGAYPWKNHPNAWRPAHIHFSFFGRAFTQRLVTQMYFEGDPLFGQDPIFNSVPDPAARERLVARFELGLTEPAWALGYRWDIVLRGREATVFEERAARR